MVDRRNVHTGMWKWVLVLGPILVLALGYRALWILRETSRPDQDDISVIAERVARLVEAYVARVVSVTSMVAVSPLVSDLAARSSHRPVLTATIDRIDAEWRQPAGRALTTRAFEDIAANPVSGFLRDLKASTGTSYREILLADNKGRLIAASNRTEDYFQADDEWWPADQTHFTASCRRFAVECATLSDVKWDPSAAGFGFAVVLPVITVNGIAVGVLKAVVDPGELDSLLRIITANTGLDIALVRSNGTRVLSADTLWNTDFREALGSLTPGAEMALRNPGDERAGWTLVRRLSGPAGSLWSVAVADRRPGDSRDWKVFALWSALTLGMFFVAATALAVTVTPSEGPPAEHPGTADKLDA